MSALEIAQARYAERQQLASATASTGAGMWSQVSTLDITGSWLSFLPRLTTILRGAQLSAARSADLYTDAVLQAQDIAVAAAGRVNASALSGVASDGRPLETLLMNPVVAAKIAIAHGATLDRAMASGRASLEMTLATQVTDAGRAADGVAIAARPRTGFVRMLVGDSCPRCVILAGRFYRYDAGFPRHPWCNCTQIPSVEDNAGDFTTDPNSAFEQGRVKGLSKADEQAIRDGADMAQVVNAHKGMYVAGARKLTRSGTTRHGLAGQRLGGSVRLMPEQIYREANSREDAVRLLKLHGYLV